MRMEPISHRASGALQANNQVWEDIANKLLPPEESEIMLKRFEKRADERVRRTYVEGVPMSEVDESAAVPRIGLTFLPGADKPQVTRLEQISMAGHEPEQRDAVVCTFETRARPAVLTASKVESKHSSFSSDVIQCVFGPFDRAELSWRYDCCFGQPRQNQVASQERRVHVRELQLGTYQHVLAFTPVSPTQAIASHNRQRLGQSCQ